jgi:signal transduction histidine kinase
MESNEFFLKSSSVAALAQFFLNLVIFLYILSLRNKTRNTWFFITTLLISCIYYISSFIENSTPYRNLSVERFFWIWLGITFLSQMWFTYVIGTNPFRRELRIVLPLTAILISIGLYVELFVDVKSRGGGNWTIPVYFIGHIWNALVLLRKSAWAGRQDFDTRVMVAKEQRIKWKEIIHTLFHPSNRMSRMFRDFAGWSLSLLAILINAICFVVLGIGDLEYFPYLHHPLVFFGITYSAIIFLNYASEMTSFGAKLMGVVLCVLLTILGLLPFILVGEGNSEEEWVRIILSTLVILLPIATGIIISILPLFFRKNLLKPLNEIVNGVKRVNEGELTTQVKIEINDELGSLAKNFNQMTASLREYALEMEKLVARRTEELSNSIDKLKSTQAQLIQSEKMASLGELTAGIAHEIQNPLNFVNNFSELNAELSEELMQEVKKDKKDEAISIAGDLKENYKMIAFHGKRADAIVKGMLQHSRTNTGKKIATNINALVKEYIRLGYHGLRAKENSFNVTIDSHLDDSIENINIVPQDIGRVLLNLFTNAFYSVHEKKKQQGEIYEPIVSVTTKKMNARPNHPAGVDTIEIKVTDNGMGIPQRILDKIFQPFFTTKPTGQGTGLGLSISYDIIKAHGGELKVETKEGEFTEFIVSLPGN